MQTYLESKSLNTRLFSIHCKQTFRPKKRFTQGTIRYSLHKQAQASLQSGINLRQVVSLPEGENLNDWIAVHGKYGIISHVDIIGMCSVQIFRKNEYSN